MHQVLLNLCVNARDAMSHGGRLTMATRSISHLDVLPLFPNAGACDYVHISVTDTGAGMDEETRNRIFDPFFTTKEVGKGTGLGLAVVYSIVDHHQGFIDVESVVGKGTTFHVYLPVLQQLIQEAASAPLVEEDIRGGTETILIVEDEGMAQEVLEAILQDKGYTTLSAMDGAEALELYRKRGHEIDLVFTDMGLPKLGGAELVAALKEINAEVTVIVCSGFLEPQVRESLRQAGVKDIVDKPYKPKLLLEKIRNVLDQP
jgi:CheY-like chemotaxis protein